MGDYDFAELLEQTRERFSLGASGDELMACLLTELKSLHSEAEALLLEQEAGDRGLIACHAGCDDCCVVNVSILLLEGFSIVKFLHQLPPAASEEIAQRLDQLWVRIRGLDDEERLAVRQKCTFLDQKGYCSIYPVRPLYCRSVTSTDAEVCKTAVISKIHGEFQPILIHQFQQQLYETLYAGIGAGLEQADLDGRSFQLSGLVRYLLRNPDEGAELLIERSLNWEQLYA